MCPVVFQGHLSNFKVTGDKKLPILTWIEHFWIVTQVWIRWWLWHYAQSSMWPRWGALLFFEVIHQIAWSNRMKNQWFESNLSKIIRTVSAIRFALLIKYKFYTPPDPSKSKSKMVTEQRWFKITDTGVTLKERICSNYTKLQRAISQQPKTCGILNVANKLKWDRINTPFTRCGIVWASPLFSANINWTTTHT